MRVTRLLLRTAMGALVLAALPAAAPDTIAIRVGNHPGYGRIVFDLPAGVSPSVHRDGDHVLVQLPGAGDVTQPRYLPSNVAAITGGTAEAEIVIRQGARLHQMRFGSRLVLDVLNAEPAPAQDAATRPAPEAAARKPPPPVASPPANPTVSAGSPARPPATVHPAGDRNAASVAASTHLPAPEPGAAHAPPVATPSNPSAAAPPPSSRTADAPALPSPTAKLPVPPATPGPSGTAAPAAAAPVQPAPALPAPAPAPAPAAAPAVEDIAATQLPDPAAMSTLSSVAVPLAHAAGPGNAAMLLPFGATTGAAAFQRDGIAIAVFDERRPLDLSSLRTDPVFRAAEVRLLPQGTMLRVKLPQGDELRLRHARFGWVVTAQPDPPAPRSIPLRPEGDHLRLPSAFAASVITVLDPQTGESLLVGTTLRDDGGMAVRRRSPVFTLAATWQGVLVEPLSDRIMLRADKQGFVLAEQGGALALSALSGAAQSMADAATLTRSFDLPNLPIAALMHRLQDATDAAATAPPQSRTAPRERVAETMIALGMGAEAQGVLALAEQQDARAAADPRIRALSAVAALVAGRVADSAALDDPHVPMTDEIALWRAVRAAMLHEGAPTAAPVFASTLKLILSYPTALRSWLLPLAAETMAEGGEAAAAQRLVDSRRDDPTLAYARGLLLAGKGNTDQALTVFDALAKSRDRLLYARAAAEAVELRIAAHRLTPAAAADALAKQFLAWRGDGRELDLRLRVAALRTEAGQYRRALALLRETDAIWPQDRAAIRAAAANTFRALISDGHAQSLPPLELVSLAAENAALLSGTDAGTALAPVLADKLIALDLPDRAAPVVQQLLAGATGTARATLGARLARLRLELDQPTAALAALTGSEVDGLPPALVAERGLLQARALAATGDTARATALLATLDTDAADDLRARMLSEAKDWTGAEVALESLVARSVPADGTLTHAQQEVLLRLATAASAARDAPELQQLREQATPRMSDPHLADLFRLLVSPPIAGPADLPRVAAEVALARALPAGLQSIGGR